MFTPLTSIVYYSSNGFQESRIAILITVNSCLQIEAPTSLRYSGYKVGVKVIPNQVTSLTPLPGTTRPQRTRRGNPVPADNPFD